MKKILSLIFNYIISCYIGHGATYNINPILKAKPNQTTKFGDRSCFLLFETTLLGIITSNEMHPFYAYTYSLTDLYILNSLKISFVPLCSHPPSSPACDNHRSAFCHYRLGLTILEIHIAYTLLRLTSFIQHYVLR